ncbi:MAG: amidase family protein [Pseudomonadales bacterium]|jgi:amidase|nr:amidase family protein [Pseudomonadales bacterium]
MAFSDYALHDATALAELVRNGSVSAAEVTEAAIGRAEALEPHLNCFVHRDFEAARASARSLDAQPVDAKDPAAPFAGVPFAVKDLWLEWAGARHSAGSRWVHAAQHRFETDAPLAAAFRATGVVSLGKTTTPEFGITGTTEPAVTGPTRNPWNPRHIAGGSSGGSAAAVAAGIVPIAHASDGAGSIRIPAACCGLVGLKPSRGRTKAPCDALDVPFAFSSNFVVSRSVRDSAAMLDAVMLHSPYGPPHPQTTFASGAQREPGALVIAASMETPSGRPVDPEIAAAFDRTCRLLERLGHHVELRAPEVDWRDFYRAFGAVGSAQLAADVRGLEREIGRPPEPDEFEPLTWRNVEAGRARTGMGVVDALRVIQRVTRRLEDFFAGIDVFLSPVLGTPLPEIGHLDPTAMTPEEQDRRSARTFPFTPPFNASGQPAVSVPVEQDAAGLPVGMQLSASYGDELVLLRLAQQLETETGWLQRRPDLAFAGL